MLSKNICNSHLEGSYYKGYEVVKAFKLKREKGEDIRNIYIIHDGKSSINNPNVVAHTSIASSVPQRFNIRQKYFMFSFNTKINNIKSAETTSIATDIRL